MTDRIGLRDGEADVQSVQHLEQRVDARVAFVARPLDGQNHQSITSECSAESDLGSYHKSTVRPLG